MDIIRLLRFFKTLALPVLVFLYFLVCFRVISRMPLGAANEIISILFLLLNIGIAFAMSGKDLLAGKMNYMFLLLLPLIVYPFINALQAHAVFNQPILYGILSQRHHYFVLGSYVVVYVLMKKILTREQLEMNFIVSMYIILAIMFFFWIFIPPSIFSGTEFVKLSTHKGWVYKFPNGVTAGLLIYSFISITKDNRYRHLITFIISAFYFIVYGQDRSQMAFIAFVCLMFAFFHLRTLKLVSYLVGGLLSVSLVVTLLLIVNPDFVDYYVDLFGNALTVVTGGHTTEDSTNIRYVESEIAMKGFEKHPLLGNGFLSSQWEDGYLQFYRYFYPADIGLMGNLYVYGIIGTIFYYLPFLAAFLWMFKLRKSRDTFLLTCIYTTIFIFLDMQIAASNIKFIGIQAFFFGVIYYYRFYYREEDSEKLMKNRLSSNESR